MSSLNILIVDDSQIIVRQLTIMLEDLGHKVIGSAPDGREAVRVYKNMRPDVVTMDITMPEMDGIEATKLIIKEDPNAKIVMVTSHGQEKMVLDALLAGAKGYVIKPFQESKVAEALAKACNIKHVPRDFTESLERRRAEVEDFQDGIFEQD